MQDKLSKNTKKADKNIFSDIIRMLFYIFPSIILSSTGQSALKLNIALPLIVCLINRRKIYFLCLPAVIIGNILFGTSYDIWLSLMSCTVIGTTYMLIKRMSAFGCGVLCFCANILSYSFFGWKFAYSDTFIFEGILNAVSSFILCAVFSVCTDIFSTKDRKLLTSAEKLCVLIFASLVGVGIANINLPFMNLSAVFTFAVVLFLGKYYFDMCMPYAFCAYIFSFILLSETYSYGICLFALSFFSVITRKYASGFIFLSTLVGVVCVCSISGLYLGDYIVELVFAQGMFMLVAHFYSNRIVTKEQISKSEKKFMDEAMSLVLNREISLQKKALKSISHAIDSKENEKNYNKSICRSLIGEVCMECENYPHCWLEEGESTYENFKAVIAASSESYSKNIYFTSRCTDRQCKELFENIKYYALSEKSRIEYDKKIGAFLKTYSSQILHLCDVMDKISCTVTKNLGFYDEASMEILSRLKASEIDVSEVTVNGDFSSALKAVIKSSVPLGEWEIKRDIPKALKDAFNVPFVYEYYKEPVSDGEYIYMYSQDFASSMKMSYSTRTKKGEAKSGDNILTGTYSHIQAAAICDGMGSGEEAGKQSEKVINMLHSLFGAGYGIEEAVEIINSALSFGGSSEIFTTLDIVLFDRITSEGIFFKAGAESGFIKRGDEIIKIKSETLPVGILESTYSKTVKFPLRRGDYVYLMSDGVISAFDYDETALMAAIMSLSSRSTQKLADDLAEFAVNKTNGTAEDDISVIVCKVR